MKGVHVSELQVSSVSFPETTFRELKGMTRVELIAEYCLGCLVGIVLECGWRRVVFLLLVATGVPRHTGCALPAALFVKMVEELIAQYHLRPGTAEDLLNLSMYFPFSLKDT